MPGVGVSSSSRLISDGEGDGNGEEESERVSSESGVVGSWDVDEEVGEGRELEEVVRLCGGSESGRWSARDIGSAAMVTSVEGVEAMSTVYTFSCQSPLRQEL